MRRTRRLTLLAAVIAVVTAFATLQAAQPAVSADPFPPITFRTGGGQIAQINSDGSGFHVVTAGPTTLAGCVPEDEYCGPGNNPQSYFGSGIMFAYSVVGPPVRTLLSTNGALNGAQIGNDGDQNPAFSPNGRLVAVESPTGLAVIDLFSWHRTPVPGSQAGDVAPQWSPNGIDVVFTRHVNGVSNVFIINTSGGPATRLTKKGCPATGGFPGCFQPTFSPDGTTIALAFGPGPGGTPGGYAIGTIPAAGGKPKALKNSAGSSADVHPSYSRDGQSIVVQNTVDTNLYILGANGIGRRQLTFSGTATAPSWRN